MGFFLGVFSNYYFTKWGNQEYTYHNKGQQPYTNLISEHLMVYLYINKINLNKFTEMITKLDI